MPRTTATSTRLASAVRNRGRTSAGASAYFNVLAGRLVAEGYELSPVRVRSKELPAVAVGKDEAAAARNLDVEHLDEIIAAGTEPIVTLPNGAVVALARPVPSTAKSTWVTLSFGTWISQATTPATTAPLPIDESISICGAAGGGGSGAGQY